MKRGKKAAGESAQRLIKSTYLLEPALKLNLAYVALAEQKDQSDIVREALAEYLDARGLNPSQPPHFNVKPKR